jgi:hypothetical protein
MYYCPKCQAKLPEDARFCNLCGFNQTNARLAALSAVPRPGQPSRAAAPVPPSRQSMFAPPAGATTNPYSDAGVPQLDFAPNVSLPGLPGNPGNQLPETPMPPMQQFQPFLTLTQRYVADQPTTIQPQPPRQPANNEYYQYATQQAPFPSVQQTPQASTLYEQAGLTQTGEIRQILRMGIKIRTLSVVNNSQHQETFTKLLPWIIIAIVVILLCGTFGLAYLLFFTHTGTALLSPHGAAGIIATSGILTSIANTYH